MFGNHVVITELIPSCLVLCVKVQYALEIYPHYYKQIWHFRLQFKYRSTIRVAVSIQELFKLGS